MKNEQLPNWYDVSRAVKRLVRADFAGAIYEQHIYRLQFVGGPNILMSESEMNALVKRYQDLEAAETEELATQ